MPSDYFPFPGHYYGDTDSNICQDHLMGLLFGRVKENVYNLQWTHLGITRLVTFPGWGTSDV
jgi:hypothetical protein